MGKIISKEFQIRFFLVAITAKISAGEILHSGHEK